MITLVHNDGGRAAAGFRGPTGDCVTRAVAIVTGRPYAEVYTELAEINSRLVVTKNRARKGVAGRKTASHGIYMKSKPVADYLAAHGFTWVPTMKVGQGCKVHLREAELPKGRIIVRLSKHAAAVIDGILHDTYDCSREGTRCVYGYWRFNR